MEKEIEHKKTKILKAGVLSAILLAAVFSGFILYGTQDIATEKIKDILEPDEEYKPTWHTIAAIEDVLFPLGEYEPGAGESGFLAMWCYEMDNTADLGTGTGTAGGEGVYNKTDYDPDGGTNSSHTVYAYGDTDSFSEELQSNDGWDFVVRARFHRDVCYSGGQFFDDRCRVNLTVSGDLYDYSDDGSESISNVTGTVAISVNDSSNQFIYINFYWNNGGNNYYISDDGTITVSAIYISAKY